MKLLITDIKKTKRGRFSVYIDTQFAGVLHSDVFYSFPYKAGDTILSGKLVEFLYQSQVNIAKERALSLLSARAYTRKGLKDKLLRDVEDAAAEEILDRMEELGLVDDLDYARRYCADCINLRGFSYYRTRQALAQRGIPREIIEETITNLEPENSEGLIYKQIQNKYRNKISDPDDIRRTIGGLQRRGYQYSDIRQVLDNLAGDLDYYNEDE